MNRSITTTSLRSHTAVASGYLHKLTHNGTPFAGWHQRYYVLYSDGLLRSYKSSRARNSHRIIQVGRKCLRLRFGSDTRSEECCRWPQGRSRSQCFSIINSDREYHFYCDSEREFASWRESLLQILAKLGSRSARSSYIERRGSKMNRVTGWLNGGSDEESQNSSCAVTPASRRKEESPWVEGKGSQEWERDGYDAMGTVPLTDLDEMAVSECEGSEDTGAPLKYTVQDFSSRDLAERRGLNVTPHRAVEDREYVQVAQRHKNRKKGLQQVSLNDQRFVSAPGQRFVSAPGQRFVSAPGYSAGNITSAVGMSSWKKQVHL